MSDSSYWSSLVSSRASRRRVLALAGGGAASALLLAACGGSDDKPKESSSSSQNKDKSGLLTQPSDTSSQAKRGGTFSTAWTTHLSWDQNFNTFGLQFTAGYVYSRLMKY